MSSSLLHSVEARMRKTAAGLKTDLATIRTGHATPALIEHLTVEYSGSTLPLNQVGTISAPEARLLVIQPWDKAAIRGIEKAIQTSDLGLNPVNDGNVIRINIPPLSEERRQELIRVVRHRLEERRVAIRNLRHDAVNDLKEQEKAKEISQDEHKRLLDQLQKITDSCIAEAERIGQDKEAELSEV